MSGRRNTRNNRNNERNNNNNNESGETIEEMVARRITEALAQYEANRASRENGGNNSNTNRTLNNDGNNNNLQGCSFKTFTTCHPPAFSGNEGAIALIHWVEKIESIFSVVNCAPEDKVKYAASTLEKEALTWWNSQVQIIGRATADSLSWDEFKDQLNNKFCPRRELLKIEAELWNLSMNGANITEYTTKFQELSRLVPHMVSPEYKKIERYTCGLAPIIKTLVTATEPTTFEDAVNRAQKLTDDAIHNGTLQKKATTGNSNNNQAYVNRNENRFNNNGKRTGENNRYNQQGSNNKHLKTAQVNVPANPTNPGAKPYIGKKPKCNRCNWHHDGNCEKCNRCDRWGHKAQNCRANLQTQGNNAPIPHCYECGDPNHYRNRCPRLVNNNNNNNNPNPNANNDRQPARGRAFVIGAQEAREDPNIVTGN